MRRAAACLILLALLAIAAPASANWRSTWCRFDLNSNGHYSVSEVRHTIWCATSHYPVPGGTRTALYIASRESGMQECAQNPTSSAAGIYQMLDSTWRTWRFSGHPYGYREVANRWHLHPSVCNARANVLVAIVQAHRRGWGPWSM